MSTERLGLSIAPSKLLSISDVVELVRLAEERDFDSVWIPETWGVDAVSVLAVLSRETRTVKLASGVLNVYSRSAALIAQTAGTLQLLSGGRFLLGLGSSGPIVVENWHGIPYTAPVQRIREYIDVVRLALSGARVDYDGAQVRLHGFRLSLGSVDPVKIYVAALGPQGVRLAGELADGWLPIFAVRGRPSQLRSEFDAAAREVGRDPNTLDVGSYLPCLISPRGERLLRQQVAYYVGGMGTFYAQFLTRMGHGAEVDRVRSLWQAGDRVGAAEQIDGALLDNCTLGWTAEAVVARLEEYRDEGMALPIVTLPHGCTPAEVAATIEAVAPRPSPIIRS